MAHYLLDLYEGRMKVYYLADGNITTVAEIQKLAWEKHNYELPAPTIYTRLGRGDKTLEELIRPSLKSQIRKTPKKVYTLNDGSKVTASDVADKVGISLTSARKRLQKNTDPKKLFKRGRPKKSEAKLIRKNMNKEIKDRVMSRNAFCPFWKLINKAV